MSVVPVVLTLAVAMIANPVWSTISASAKRGPAQNDEARRLVAGGHAGLMTGHTHHPELTLLPDGFYANTGSGTNVVDERRSSGGLPAMFLSHRQLSWIEPEAGADLPVRLLHSWMEVAGGATRVQRATSFSLLRGS